MFRIKKPGKYDYVSVRLRGHDWHWVQASLVFGSDYSRFETAVVTQRRLGGKDIRFCWAEETIDGFTFIEAGFFRLQERSLIDRLRFASGRPNLTLADVFIPLGFANEAEGILAKADSSRPRPFVEETPE